MTSPTSARPDETDRSVTRTATSDREGSHPHNDSLVGTERRVRAAAEPAYEPFEDEYPHIGGHPVPPPPLTERDGLTVGDSVTLVAHHGAEWPAQVVGFTSLDCDVVVEWTGVSPSLDKRSTICRKQLREVRHA